MDVVPPADYAWLTDPTISPLAVAGCVTAASGCDTTALAACFGADLAATVDLDEATIEGVPAVGLIAGSAGCLAIEQNGFEGSREPILKRASRRGRSASVLWNVEGLAVFSCASRGKMVGSFELPLEEVGELPQSVRALGQAARQGETDMVAVAADMVVLFTGVSITPAALVTAPGHPITRPVAAVRTPGATLIELGMPSQLMVERVLAASDQERRELAAWAVLHALDQAGLRSARRFRSLTLQIEQNEVPRLSPEVALAVGAIDRTMAKFETESPDQDATVDDARHEVAARRYWAAQAVLYVCEEDSTTAALGAAYCASVCELALGNAAFLTAAEGRLRN